jgi:hypothetical protein
VPKRSRRRRLILLALAAVMASCLLAIAIFAIRLYPWIRMPAESRKTIEARWKKLEVAAEVRDPNADNAMLVAAITAFHGVRPPPNDAKTIQRSALSEKQAARRRLPPSGAAGRPFHC